jgi:nitrogenase iron protein NifH
LRGRLSKVIPKLLDMDDLEKLLMEYGLEEEGEEEAIGKEATA